MTYQLHLLMEGQSQTGPFKAKALLSAVMLHSRFAFETVDLWPAKLSGR